MANLQVHFLSTSLRIVLHVFYSLVDHTTIFNSNIVGNYWADSPLSMLPIYKELIAAGLKIWVYR